MNEQAEITKSYEALYARDGKRVEANSATAKAIGEYFYRAGFRDGKDSEMREAYSFEPMKTDAARAI